MKNYAIISLTVVSALVAVSCQKEDGPAAKSEYSPAAIKAEINAINGKYEVLWQENDRIYLTDGTNGGTYTLSAGKGSTIGTFNRDAEVKYSGVIQAYYPETLIEGATLVWPAVQTMNQAAPLYGNCNLTGTDPESLKLTGMGAVLQILYVSSKETIVLKSIRIKDAEKTMSGTFEVDAKGQAVITATDGSGITINLGQDGVTVGKEVQKFYVAIPAGEYNNLSVIFNTSEGEQVLLNRKVNARVNTVCSLSLNSSLSVSKESVQLWEGGPFWATTNIGAATPEDIGLFYAWGFYKKGQGCLYAGTVWYGQDSGNPCLFSFSTDYKKSHGFDIGTSFSDYNTHKYEDIAQFEWGEKWRLPTKEEFQGLLDNCTFDYVSSGTKGMRFTGKGEYSDKSIFFPFTGYGYEKEWLHKEDGGYYWSSTAISDGEAYALGWLNGEPAVNHHTKYYGYPVRPVTDDTSKPVMPENVLSGKFSRDADHTIYFTKGNLFYDYKDETFHFEENQYDYPAEWDIYHVGHFFWSENESVAYAKASNGKDVSNDQVFFTNSKSDPSKPRADFAVDGITGKYRTLLETEWKHILNDRPNASSLKKTGVTVCDKKNCLILAPDDYKGTIQSSYDAESWLKAESEGLVCLPASGHRIGINTMLGETGGYYSTFDPLRTILNVTLHFRSNHVYTIYGEHSFGYSVRLVYVD